MKWNECSRRNGTPLIDVAGLGLPHKNVHGFRKCFSTSFTTCNSAKDCAGSTIGRGHMQHEEDPINQIGTLFSQSTYSKTPCCQHLVSTSSMLT